MTQAFTTYPCDNCGQPFTVQLFGVLAGDRSMLSSIPTDETLRLHDACFEMGSQ